MAQTLAVLIPGSYLTTSPAAYYTVPATKQTVIRRLVITNVSSGDVTVTLNLVASGGSTSIENRVISVRTIASGESYVSPECANQVLGSSGKIVGVASVNNALTVYASGTEA